MKRLLPQRLGALLLLLVVIPGLISLGSLDGEQALRAGERSPRQVVATQTVTVEDEVATEEARSVAEQEVEPVLRNASEEERAAIVQDVRDVFAAVREARRPVPLDDEDGGTQVPSTQEQLDDLVGQDLALGEDGLQTLVQLTGGVLSTVESEMVRLAQDLARERFARDELEETVSDLLDTEVPLLPLEVSEEVRTQVIRPLLREVARPTRITDADATAVARETARASVEPVAETFVAGEPIAEVGQVVTPLMLEAMDRMGLQGLLPWQLLVRAAVAMLLVTVLGSLYMQRMHPKVWGSGRRILLVAAATTLYAGGVAGISALHGGEQGWWYLVPAGGLAMLVSLTLRPGLGVVMMLPAVVLVIVAAPVPTAVPVYVLASVLVTVPLTTQIGSRGDLRTAILRAAVAMPIIAFVTVGMMGPQEDLGLAVVAATLSGVMIALLVLGVMPFLETMFRLPTVTALLDLNDRNHPLLRELETQAIGSYNHSVMVASLVERACREVGANALLGSVAALYHDIGKVRRPHFFIENQQGIANPHDELPPEISAVIIQEHVIDGVKMAKEYRLPPEVCECILSHHGTMKVSYFYNQAVAEHGEENVDEDHFRYKGTRPKSKEAGILVIADCSEATTRSMAMNRGTLPREEIEQTVDRLVQERVEDDQFAECNLTFDEMRRVRNSVVDALVGIYHPRIAYPPSRLKEELEAQQGVRSDDQQGADQSSRTP